MSTNGYINLNGELFSAKAADSLMDKKSLTDINQENQVKKSMSPSG
jgi:hypothetical protein